MVLFILAASVIVAGLVYLIVFFSSGTSAARERRYQRYAAERAEKEDMDRRYGVGDDPD